MSQSNVTMSGVEQIDSISNVPQYASFYLNGGQWTITDSVIVKDFSGNGNIGFNTGSTLTRCTFFIKCASVGSTGIQGGKPILNNSIIMSDNSSAINDNAIDPSTCSHSCFFQMHSNDTSGGTNNIFADPQFVDSATGDLRLRPSSPCINAGTAS